MNIFYFAQNELRAFENLNPKDRDTAAWEIVLMLLGAYLLGLLTCWLIHNFVRGNKKSLTTTKRVSSIRSSKVDDLTIIEGIGPKINNLLHKDGIKTFEDLADTSKSQLQKILDEAGPKFRIHDPATWSKQARLAAGGKFKELERLQDRLTGGR